MTPSRHALPEPLFRDLAAGGGGAGAARRLAAAAHGKHLLLVRRVVDAAEEAGHPSAARARAAYAALADIEAHDPAAVAAVLGYPTVGVWARRTALALTGRDTGPAWGAGAARVEMLAALAAAASVRSTRPLDIELAADDGGVVLPSLGRALLPVRAEDAVTFRSKGPGAEISAGGVTVAVPADPHVIDGPWQGLRTLDAHHGPHRVSLLLDDVDPYRIAGAAALDRRLDEDEIGLWQERLREDWTTLAEHHWTIAEETAEVLTSVTPMSDPGAGLTSATVQNAFGGIGVSFPRDRHAFAVTFAHEVQHTKLCALLDMTALTLPDDGRRFYAPWRDDPRPAAGVLQGVYAHLGIAGFWRRQRHVEPDAATERTAHVEFVRWRTAALTAARTLAEGECLTPDGEAFVRGTAATLEAWAKEEAPADVVAKAETASRIHREEWEKRNGTVGG